MSYSSAEEEEHDQLLQSYSSAEEEEEHDQLLLQSYSSAEEEEHDQSEEEEHDQLPAEEEEHDQLQYVNSSDDNEVAGAGTGEDSGSVSNKSLLESPKLPPSSLLPSDLGVFSQMQIAGPLAFLKGRSSVMVDGHRWRHGKDKPDLPAGAVLEAKAQLVGIHERVRSDAEGNTTKTPSAQSNSSNPIQGEGIKRVATATNPNAEDAAALLRHQLGIKSDIGKVNDDFAKRSGFKVAGGSIKSLMPHEATGLPNQEGEGSSSKETQEALSTTELKSCLQHISDAAEIPLSKVEEMYKKKILDVSSDELPYLPKDIGKLDQLECLKVSIYEFANCYIKRKNIDAIIPRGELSKLQHLKELSIKVVPDCEWWDAEAKAIIDEILGFEKLEILDFYFPTEDLLKQFLKDEMEVYKALLDFKLIVGRHHPEIIFRVPHKLQLEFEKSRKCLKYVGGELDNQIGRVLEHAESLFLNRHRTTKRLSEFNLRNLVCCLLVECNDMIAIFDASDFVPQEKSPQNLRFLSVHHMQNVRCLWTGPIVKDCLKNLEILILHILPELTTIFTPDLLCNLRNLKQVIVMYCPRVTSLITEEPRDSNSSSDQAFAPNLQIILLLHMPKLTSFSSFLNDAPKLEKVVVYNCPKLKKPSSSDKLYSKYREIQDNYDWSNEIPSKNVKKYMRRIFRDL